MREPVESIVTEEKPLVIDGSYGEGGGQILRSALALSAFMGRSLRIEHIRAGRKKPGLAAQHLLGVLATAKLCAAELEGAQLGSQALAFVPRRASQPGRYVFDVAEARRGGSAGAASLVFQTIHLPLALVEGSSEVVLKGGTHVPWSPPYHYLESVYAPMTARLGLKLALGLERWGFYPQGGGIVRVRLAGGVKLQPLELRERGDLSRIRLLSAVARLPRSIAQRQARRAEELLREEGLSPEVDIEEVEADSPGTFVSVVAEFENSMAGFSALGERGKSAERVAEEAFQQFIDYYRSGQAIDPHLADQLVLPLALAQGPSSFTTSRVTQHLLTNIWVVERFLPVRFDVRGELGSPGSVVCHLETDRV